MQAPVLAQTHAEGPITSAIALLQSLCCAVHGFEQK